MNNKIERLYIKVILICLMNGLYYVKIDIKKDVHKKNGKNIKTMIFNLD